MTVREAARTFGFSPMGVQRHRRNCAGVPPSRKVHPERTAEQAAPLPSRKAWLEPAPGALATLPSREELGVAYGDLRGRIDAVVRRAQEAGSLTVALQGLNALRQSLDSVSRLAGHDQPATPQVNINISVNAVVQEVLAVLGPTPSPAQVLALEDLADGE